MNSFQSSLYFILIIMNIVCWSLSTRRNIDISIKRLEEKIIFLEEQVREANESIDILGYNENYLLDLNKS